MFFSLLKVVCGIWLVFCERYFIIVLYCCFVSLKFDCFFIVLIFLISILFGILVLFILRFISIFFILSSLFFGNFLFKIENMLCSKWECLLINFVGFWRCLFGLVGIYLMFFIFNKIFLFLLLKMCFKKNFWIIFFLLDF